MKTLLSVFAALAVLAASEANAGLLDRLWGGGCGYSCCEPSCAAEPTCGCEPSCAAEPTCGCAPSYEAGCGCEPSCGCQPSCCHRRINLLGGLFGWVRRACQTRSCCHSHHEASCGCEPSCGCHSHGYGY